MHEQRPSRSEDLGNPRYTKKELSDWKRRERGRLTRLKKFLVDSADQPQSYGTLDSLGAGLVQLISELESEAQRLSELRDDHKVDVRALKNRIGGGSWNLESRDSVRLSWRQHFSVKKAGERLTAVETTLVGAEASHAQLQTALDEARTELKDLRKYRKKIFAVLPMPMLETCRTQSFLGIVDRREAELGQDSPPTWITAEVASHVEEAGAKEKEASATLRRLSKERSSFGEELSRLQASEPARKKQIEDLERRLKREKQRQQEERRFIGEGLVKKYKGDGLNKRETAFVHPGWNGLETFEYRWLTKPNSAIWERRGSEYSSRLRTHERNIRELTADLESLQDEQKRQRSLGVSIRSALSAIASAEQAGDAGGVDEWPRGSAPRIGYIADAHTFEKFMATWMQWLGWSDARAMPVGPDGGIDVTATGALGQAKHWDNEVGIEEVQRHNGVCEGIPKHGRVFLAKNGYTPQAIKWANDRGLPLFQMKPGTTDAGVVGSTKAAERLLQVGARAMNNRT